MKSWMIRGDGGNGWVSTAAATFGTEVGTRVNMYLSVDV